MTLDDLARMISRGFAAIADGQDAIAAELRANRVHFGKVKGQRELDKEAHADDIAAIGAHVQTLDQKVRLHIVPSPPGGE
jgi:hypothetical protein